MLIAPYLLAQAGYGQAFAQYTPGYIIELRGHVLDATNRDTMALSKIKLLSGDQVIGERTADFDGAFHIRFCSNKVKSDSVVIEGEGLGCLPTRISLKAVTDLALNIYLKLDTAFISSEHAKQEYLHNLYVDRRECGTDEFQRDYDADMQFRHCDGRVESFRRLFELNERMEEWERF